MEEDGSADMHEPAPVVWIQTHISSVLRALTVLRHKTVLRMAREAAPGWMTHTHVVDPMPTPEAEALFLRTAQKVGEWVGEERRNG